MQGPLIYYNRDVWAQLGFGGFPTTWDELLDLAKRGTKYDGNQMTQCGFSYSYEYEAVFMDILYQKGGWLFNEDVTAPAWNTTAAYEAVDFMAELAAVSVSNQLWSPPKFEEGNGVMMYSWAWRQSQFRAKGNLNFGGFALPSFTGSPLPKLGRMAIVFGLAVPDSNPEVRKRESFAFLDWLYNNDERYRDINRLVGTLPARVTLWNDSWIQENDVLKTMTRTLPYMVFPGSTPDWMLDQFKELNQKILAGTESPHTALHKAQQVGEAIMKENPLEWVVERGYRPPAD